MSVEEAVPVVVASVLSGIPSPPTNLEAVAERLGVVQISGEELSISGELRRERAGLKIVYSSMLPPGRRRFTIAHELGHAIFETTGPGCPRSGKELERLCDMLAKELLMPTDKFKARLQGPLSLEKLNTLAREFDASLASTAIRCAELRDVSVLEVENGIVMWSRGRVRALGPWLEPFLRDVVATGAAKQAVHLQPDRIGPEFLAEGVRLGKGERILLMFQQIRTPTRTTPDAGGLDVVRAALEVWRSKQGSGAGS